MDRCIYCGAPATTDDHVPPTCFLEKGPTADRATVPCCLACNHQYSKNEEYAIALLAEIGTSPALTDKIDAGGVVDRAFARRPAFEQRFIDRESVDASGRVVIEPEIDRLELVLRKIVAGLYWLRYGREARIDSLGPIGFWPYNIEDRVPVGAFLAVYSERFEPKRWTAVQRRVFEYIFAKQSDGRLGCVIKWHDTLWVTCVVPWPSGAAPSQEPLPFPSQR